MLDLIANWWPYIGIVLALVWAIQPPLQTQVGPHATKTKGPP